MAACAAQTRENYHGKLKAFGRMDGHNPNAVIVGFRHRDFHRLRAFPELPFHPVQVAAQGTSAGVDEFPGLLHNEPQTAPPLPGAAASKRQFHHAAVPYKLLYQLIWRGPNPLVMELPEFLQGLSHRTGSRAWLEIVEPPAVVDELQQLHVAAGEGRRPQCSHHGHLVGRAIDGPETVQQFPHVLSRHHHGLAFDSIRDIGLLQGLFQYVQAGPGWQQQADVPELGIAQGPGGVLPHLPPVTLDLQGQSRNCSRFLPPHVSRGSLQRLAHPVHAEWWRCLRWLPAGLQMLVICLDHRATLVRTVNGGVTAAHPLLEHVVGPIEYACLRPEVLA